MPIDTNLNTAPYFDDYSENSDYYKVLFRPGVALQARELTQLQSILQNQIEKFGDNIYRVGTIIKGCNLVTDYNYHYIKILDTTADGFPVTLSTYNNSLLVQEGTGLSAYVVNYTTGYESLNPDLNTLYLKYINTGSGGEKVFANSQVITVYDKARTVESLSIVTGGSGYSNSDVVVFTSLDTGAGAVATITTDADGAIIDVSVTSKGSNYKVAPTVSITTDTGIGAELTAVISIAQVTVAGSSFTAPVGIGAAVKSADGIIYQKGHFVRVDAQEAILTKYTTIPDGVSIGFAVNESIVNSSVDETLLDLSYGSPNYSAPGANRLKLTPTLKVVNTASAISNSQFLPLLEFEGGKVVKDRTDTQFNSVNRELAKRTYDESGNYVLSQFALNTQPANSTHIDVTVGPGVAYVNGNRIQLINNSKKAIRKGNDVGTDVNHSTSTAYGNYILIDQMVGVFDVKTGATINLRDTAGTDVTDNFGRTPTTPGSVIGTAKVKSIEYSSGTPGTPECQYRVYIFDVVMNSGYSFGSVRSISTNGVALADIVLDASGKAAIKDNKIDTLIFNTGIASVKEFTSEDFVFRTSTNATFTTAGSITITFSGGNTLPYSGTLTDTLKSEIVVIPTANIYSSSAATGTVTANTDTATIVGSGTSFTTNFQVGEYIFVGNSSVYSTPQRIIAIDDNTHMRLSGNFNGLGGSSNASSNSISKAYAANVPIDFSKTGKVISAPSSTSLTLDLGHGIRSTPAATFSAIHNLINFEPSVKAKTLNNPVYVKLSTAKLTADNNGPWCLGIPDVLSIEGVYVGTSTTYSDTTTNYASQFELQSGQKDNYYGLSYIRLKPNATLSLTGSNNLLVKVKVFTHGTGKYISTESYPVDDVTVPLPSNKVRTQDIPYFVSPSTGDYIDLKNAIDFRPIVSNTAILSSTVGGASIDPSSVETLITGEKFFPSPSDSFESTVSFYYPRIDRLVLDRDGNLQVVEGLPSLNPSAPISIKDTMDIGLINVTPYPSLSAKESSTLNRPDLNVVITPLQTKGYNMKDIGDLDKRIRTLEYYSLISSLESNTINITIPSEANSTIERFKNGFIVDSFDSYNVSRTNDNEFRSMITSSSLVPLVNTTVVDIIYDSSLSSGVTKTGDVITLPYTTKQFVSQPYANKERTLVEQSWSFAGTMEVIPSYDNFFDNNVSATSAINIDLATPMNALVTAVNEAFKNNAVVTTSTTTQTGNDWWWWWWGRSWTDTITTTTTTTNQIKANAATVTDTQQVGNFLTDVRVSPYIREQIIAINIHGLRPGASHYLFFDGVDLTARTWTATEINGTLVQGQFGQPLIASSIGQICAFISIPGNTFVTGEKNILVMDVDNLDSELSATSKSVGKFSAFSLKGDSTNVTFSTRNFDTSKGDIFTVNTFSNTQVSTQRTWNGWWGGWWGWGDDPLAQTFTVEDQQGGDMISLTSVDIYFKAKDSSLGVTLEIRETDESGYPTSSVLPFSRVHLAAAQVAVSSTAATPTTFTFSTPVNVKTGRDYAVVMYPDQNSPEYRVWTCKAGLPDVGDNTITPNATWGKGTMFFSTSGKAFTAVQDEDIKFAVRRANYTATTGTIGITNGDNEYLTVTGTNGSYTGGEDVAQMANSYINTTLTTNTAVNVINTSTDVSSQLSVGDKVLVIYGTNQAAVTGNVSSSGTSLSNGTSVSNNSFIANFANGDFIRVGNDIRQVIAVNSNTSITLDVAPTSTITDGAHYTIDPVFDVMTVLSANSTTVTVNKFPSYTSNSTIKTSFQKVVGGKVSTSLATSNSLIIANSTASSDSFKLRTANSTYFGYVIGSESQATAKVSEIRNVNSSSFVTNFNTLVTKGTSASLSCTLTKTDNSTDTSSYSLNGVNLTRFGDIAVIKSKSNEISGSTITKSFKGALAFSTQHTDTTPILDLSSSVLFNNFLINNSTTNENTRYGSAQCKYITKTLTLAEGLDAEDIRLYLDAYKPVGTDISVYAKLLNASDGTLFDDKDWSKLDQVTPTGTYSSALSTQDIREFEYTFPRSPAVTDLVGVVSTTSTTSVTGAGTTFNTDLAVGDLVKITNTDPNADYDIIPVALVGGATSLTLAAPTTFTGTGLIISKVTDPQQAFKYCRNSGIVRYYDANKSAYDGYKYIAIKIVLTSQTGVITPRVDSLRAIACSV